MRVLEMWLLVSGLLLPCGDPLRARGQAADVGDRGQAAIRFDMETADGSVSALADVEELAVAAQGHIGGSASGAQ